MESNTNGGVALSEQLRADLRLAWSLTQEAGHTTAADRIFAFIGSAARAAPGVPAGWKLVPVEATDEQIKAMHCIGGSLATWNELANEYRVMVGAAPSAPAGISQQAGGAVPVDRDSFEAWAKREGHENFMRMAGDPDQYDDLILRANFKGWMAANPALAVPVQADRGIEKASRVGKSVAIGSDRIIVATAIHAEWADEIVAALNVPAPLPLPEGPSEALRELMSIVEIHSDATGSNFAWAEMIAAREALAATPVVPPASPSAQFRPKGFSCAKRAADPSNEFAACREWCGDAAMCFCQLLSADGAVNALTDIIRKLLDSRDARLLAFADDLMNARSNFENPPDVALPGSTPDAAQGGA